MTAFVYTPPSGFGVWTGLGDGVTGFDSGTAVNTTLSNNNLTATHSNTTTNSGAHVLNTTGLSTGKFYWEITVDLQDGNGCIGAMTTTATFTNFVTNGTNCVAVYRGDAGNKIWSNNAATAYTLNHYTTGDNVGVALDLTNHLGWMRKNGGQWNTNATADPASGVNGFTLASATFVPAVGFTSITGAAFTANFAGLSSSMLFYLPPLRGFLRHGSDGMQG